MIFSLTMAWAYFKKVWSKGVLGIMVLISIAGVALGVAALVVTLSVMNGFHSKITSKLLSLNPHIIITDSYGKKDKIDNLYDKIEDTKGIKDYASFIYGRGLIQKRSLSNGVVIKGIKPGINNLTLNKGSWENLNNDEAVIGKELADMLGLDVSDEAFIIIPRVTNITSPVIPRIKKVKISGIFNSGMYEYDAGVIYININTAQNIIPSGVSTEGIELYLNDPFKAEDISKKLRKKTEGYIISTWQERNRNLFAALKLEKTMMFIVLVMIIIIATFNIAGSLIMVAVTRSRDCGVMRAVGATKLQIRRMFHFKGLLIGFSGTVIGIMAGLGLSFLVSKYEIIKLPPKVYLISHMPVSVNYLDIIIVAVTAMAVSYIATIYPAVRAGSIEISEELSYE